MQSLPDIVWNQFEFLPLVVVVLPLTVSDGSLHPWLYLHDHLLCQCLAHDPEGEASAS